MQGKVISAERQPMPNHRLWKGQSGSIYFQDRSGNKICLIHVGSGPDVGHTWSNDTGSPWEPFFGKIELSE